MDVIHQEDATHIGLTLESGKEENKFQGYKVPVDVCIERLKSFRSWKRERRKVSSSF